jgi:glycosyltransferase involved in cell wall biosynthesis
LADDSGDCQHLGVQTVGAAGAAGSVVAPGRRARRVEPVDRPADGPLRVALLSYRADPRCGGQGVYLRNLSAALVAAGHEVTVLAGPPYPDLDPSVRHIPVPSLDLNPPPHATSTADGRRRPRSWPDAVELGRALTGGFGEPQAFALRARRLLRSMPGAFDVVHDNQSLGPALTGVAADGWPVLATVHHPLTVDRDAALARAESPAQHRWVRRWWSFVDQQAAVARRLPMVLTVSEASAGDIAGAMGVRRDRLVVVPVGTDPVRFHPRADVAAVPGRLVTVSSADVPLKGLVHLIEAMPAIRRARSDAHLVVVARGGPTGAVAAALERHGLHDVVRFVSGLDDDDLVAELCRAEVAVVPSLYEGFSLPAVEAMACARPLVATTGGALPEVVGRDGSAGLLVPPGQPAPLADAVVTLLADPARRASLGATGRQRVLDRFTWERCAQGTIAAYRSLLAGAGPVRIGSLATAASR